MQVTSCSLTRKKRMLRESYIYSTMDPQSSNPRRSSVHRIYKASYELGYFGGKQQKQILTSQEIITVNSKLGETGSEKGLDRRVPSTLTGTWRAHRTLLLNERPPPPTAAVHTGAKVPVPSSGPLLPLGQTKAEGFSHPRSEWW